MKYSLEENEKLYGKEIREKYGDDVVDAANKKYLSLTEQDKKLIEDASVELSEALIAAVLKNSPESADGKKVYEAHKRWLCFFWQEYNPEAHIGLAKTYTQDPRFEAHYEKIITGATAYLYAAIKAHAVS